MAAFIHTGGPRGTAVNNGGVCATISTNETNQLKTGSGMLGRLIVENVGTSMTVDIYDHQSTTSNKIAEYVSADGKVNREYNLPFGLGLRVVVGGTAGLVHVIFQ